MSRDRDMWGGREKGCQGETEVRREEDSEQRRPRLRKPARCSTDSDNNGDPKKVAIQKVHT